MKISRSTVDDHESQYDLTRDRRGGVGGCFGYSFSSEVGVTNADSKLIIKCISDQKLDSGESLGIRLSDLGSSYPLPPTILQSLRESPVVDSPTSCLVILVS